MAKVDLMQGDCLELLKKIPDGSVDMILTDPPYYVGMKSNGYKATYTELTMLKPFFEQVFSEWKRILKTNGLVYCFTDWRTLPFLAPIFDWIIGQKNLLVWDKAGRMSANYGFYHELILFGGEGQRKIYKKIFLKLLVLLVMLRKPMERNYIMHKNQSSYCKNLFWMQQMKMMLYWIVLWGVVQRE